MNGTRDKGDKKKANRRKQSMSGWSAWVDRGEGRGVVATDEHESWMVGYTMWSNRFQMQFQVQKVEGNVAHGQLGNGTPADILLKDLTEIDTLESKVGDLVLAPFEEPCSAVIGSLAEDTAIVVFDDYAEEGAFQMPTSELVQLDEPMPFRVGQTVGAPYPIYYEAILFRVIDDDASVVFIGWEEEGEFWLKYKELAEAPPTTKSQHIDQLYPLWEENQKKQYLQNELEVMRTRCENILGILQETLLDNEQIRKEKCALARETCKEMSRLNMLLKGGAT